MPTVGRPGRWVLYFSDFRGRAGRGEVVGRTETDRAGPIPPRGPRRGRRRAGAGRALGVPAGLDGRFVPGQSRDDAARLARLDGGRCACPRGVPRPRAGWPPGRRRRIRPAALHGPPYVVPEGLAERIADRAITDARGRAVLTAFFPEEISTVFVSAPGLGRQQFGFESYPGSRKPRTIDLSPVGRVEGRIVADDPEIARNRKLLAVISGRTAGVPALGLEYLTTDPQGRFVIPQAPAGGLSVYGNPPRRFALVPLVGERPEGRGRPDDPGRGQGLRGGPAQGDGPRAGHEGSDRGCGRLPLPHGPRR